MGGIDKIINMEEITEKRGNIIWRAALAEFFGNALLNIFGCGCIVFSPKDPGTVLIALTFGFTIYVLVQTLGHVSGGHFNPAVSAGMFATGKIGVVKLLIYILAQCLGAIAGTAILLALSPDGYKGNYGNTVVNENYSEWQGLICEILLGFILVFTVFGFCDPDRPETNPTGSLSVGFAIAIGHLCFVSVTGSSMNPARSLGSAVIANEFADHWVYWVGPILGGVLAALLYRWIFAKADLGYEGVPTEELQRLDAKQTA